MSSRLQFVIKNLFCFICFYLDFRTGGLAASFFLIAAICIHLVRAFFRKEHYFYILILTAPYFIWFGMVLIVGLISNELAHKEVQRICEEVMVFKSETGKYPDSLKALKKYSNMLDNHGHLHVGGSEIFLSEDTIVYRKFPGFWESYNMESKQEKKMDVY